MRIGPYLLTNALFVAPMAGVTDRPFRKLCKQLGAGYAVSEMVTSRRDLWHTLKTSRRADHQGEPGPIAVQIAGTDGPMMPSGRLNWILLPIIISLLAQIPFAKAVADHAACSLDEPFPCQKAGCTVRRYALGVYNDQILGNSRA